MMKWHHTFSFMLLGLAGLAASCQSFDQLRADDPGVSELEVAEAAESDDPALTVHLRRILQRRGEYETDVVISAVDSLSRREDRAGLQEILALCGDEDEELRWHVAVALHALGGPEAEAALARMARSDESPLVREAASGKL